MEIMQLNVEHQEKLINLCEALVDQSRAAIVVRPMESAEGFWFGSGTLSEDLNGKLLLTGRYRNAGDSRTGLYAGDRGVELAVFRSGDDGRSFEKIQRYSKADLSVDGKEVVSIEGSCLVSSSEGVELYVSTEKNGIGYPAGLESFQKPGTGVWTIDCIKAASISGLKAGNIRPYHACEDPRYLHVKDPVAVQIGTGEMMIVFCTHPFCWSSANSGLIIKKNGSDAPARIDYDFFPRGFTWDVAISRITDIMKVPKIGKFAQTPDTSLVFYDGGESLRKYEEHQEARRRPRGYSCEEIGGAGFMVSDNFPAIDRLSVNEPLFVSPYGTGSSRYVRTLVTGRGIYATWQQSQPDLSQPLVINFLSNKEIENILN